MRRSPDEERAQLGLGVPPVWAERWGQDRYGVFASFVIGEVAQRMRWIAPGTFMMGSPEDEPGRSKTEILHRVTLTHGFWMADTPCTQGLWTEVMGDNPSRFVSPRRPVENVSWDEVQEFVGQLNGRCRGLEVELPTEAQWEYACRAGTSTATYAGPMEILGIRNAPVLHEIAWYGGNSGVEFDLPKGSDSSGWKDKQFEHERAGTREVGLKRANAWGLCDMLGNVEEWCADNWGSYDESVLVDPGGPASGSLRVYRGGCWNDHARGVRAAYRRGDVPGDRLHWLGFRLVRGQGLRQAGERSEKQVEIRTRRDGEASGGDRSGDRPAPPRIEVLQRREERTAVPEGTADALEVRAHALYERGDLQEALRCADRVVELRRLEFEREPDGDPLRLAEALDKVGLYASSQREHGRAEPALREAISISKSQLGGGGPSTGGPFVELLSSSLNYLATIYIERGLPSEALPLALEALEYAGALVESWAEHFEPVYAGILNNVSTSLAALGRLQEALRYIAEAVKLSRRFAESGSTEQLVGLARSLYTFGLRVRELGRGAEAVQPMTESDDILTKLVESGESSLRGELGAVRAGRAGVLLELDEVEAARDVSASSVEILREVSQEQPGVLVPNFPPALNNLGNSSTGLSALEAFKEAIEYLRPFVSIEAPEILADFGVMLSNIGRPLTELGRHEEAIDAAREAVGIQRELVSREHERSRTFLVGALKRLGDCLSVEGSHEEAIASLEEAVEVRRDLVVSHPEQRPALATDLVNLSSSLTDGGRGHDAVALTHEALELYARLVSEGFGSFDAERAVALHNLARHEGALENWRGLVGSAGEAVALRRALSDKDFDQRRRLVQSLKLLAAGQLQLEDQEGAVESLTEAILLISDAGADDREYRSLMETVLAATRAHGIELPAALRHLVPDSGTEPS